MTKPSDTFSWESTTNTPIDPGALGAAGYGVGAVPTSPHINYVFRTLSRGFNWLKTYAAGVELNNTFTGSNNFNGPAGDSNPVLTTQIAVTTRKELHGIDPVNLSGIKCHVYMTSSGTLERAYNCHWTGSAWAPDYEATGYVYWKEVLGTGAGWLLYGFSRDAEATWADNLFTLVTAPSQGVLNTSLVSTASTGGNPDSNVALSNSLRAALWPKAWGLVALGATPSVVDGQNIASVGYQVSNTALRVTFAAGFPDAGSGVANICCTGGYSTPITPTGVYVVVGPRTTTYADFYPINYDGSHLDMTTVTGAFLHINVFGKQ